jgi:hypothetical protein
VEEPFGVAAAKGPDQDFRLYCLALNVKQ